MIEAGAATKAVARLLAVTLTLFAAGSDPTAAANPRADVIRSYNTYRDAIVRDNGKVAVQYVCARVIDYFGEIQELALYARKAELTAEPLIDQLHALQFRMMIPSEELTAMSSSELFVHAADNGWVLKNSVKQSSLGGITIRKDEAEAVLMMGNTPAGGAFHFCKEDDQWKFNLLTVIEHSGEQLAGVARHRGLSGEEMILQVLSGASGEKVPSKLWKPPFKKKK